LQYEGKYYDLGSVSGFVKANNDFWKEQNDN
jgi:UTP-glucose-1-phosphate uridylyltransferase